MDLRLIRSKYLPDGIFGSLVDSSGNVIAMTLEHSFDCAPKVPPGSYLCARGIHRLHDGVDFTTFEITGVSGHVGILFHVGNANSDSEGCVLLGESIHGSVITNSRTTFDKFMRLQDGVNEFELTVA